MSAIIHTGPPLYVGPVDIYDRYMSGEVVTQTDLLKDQSPWTVKKMHKRDSDRLRWMLDNLETPPTNG